MKLYAIVTIKADSKMFQDHRGVKLADSGFTPETKFIGEKSKNGWSCKTVGAGLLGCDSYGSGAFHVSMKDVTLLTSCGLVEPTLPEIEKAKEEYAALKLIAQKESQEITLVKNAEGRRKMPSRVKYLIEVAEQDCKCGGRGGWQKCEPCAAKTHYVKLAGVIKEAAVLIGGL